MERTPTLSLCQKLSFSIGHFYNDLCSAMWFTYLLIFFTNIIGMSNSFAGYALLLGQVVDAVSTPFIGYESDATPGFCGYGKRKSWHLLGTVLVTISFTFLFLPCFGGSNSDDWAKFIYYAPFVAVFQFGWAAVQIAHMTLVTELTPDESERVGLNSYRNAMTLFANVIVYSVAWVLFRKNTELHWSASDSFLFMILMISVVSIGLVCSILFHVFTKETNVSNGEGDDELINIQNGDNTEKMLWHDWLKEPQFYMVGLCYMASRLISNISQTYWPFYIMESLELNKQFAAIIPLVVFVAGFFTSLLMKPVNSLLGRKPSFILGSVITGAALLWMAFLNSSLAMQIFGSAIILGIGSTTLLVTSLSMIADVIGNHTNSSAFVYGVMSFCDKLSSGVVLMVVQSIEPSCVNSLKGLLQHCPTMSSFFYGVMVYLLAGFAAVCFLMYFVLLPFTLGSLRKFRICVNIEDGEISDSNSNPVRNESPQQDLQHNEASERTALLA